MVLLAELLPIHAEVMPEPGAYKSTHEPVFEYDAIPSALVVAPIVIADGARDGE